LCQDGYAVEGEYHKMPEQFDTTTNANMVKRFAVSRQWYDEPYKTARDNMNMRNFSE
jgi:hypothetical protein